MHTFSFRLRLDRTPRTRYRGGLRAAAAALLALSVVSITAAAYAAIDPWPSYQPQTVCSPTAKRGTLELARYLQRKYPGSGSYGISRACGSGGKSEHKEGRAFDWRVNVYNSKERAYAYNFIKRVRATDAAGNNAALARRMGIMYIIWNDVIYSSSRNFAPRAYLNSGCSSKASCSGTLRHRNHVHISLTRAGGQGKTSWYGNHELGSGPTTPPSTPTQPTPPDIHEEDHDIPTMSLSRPVVLEPEPGETVRTSLAVRKGTTVKVTAYGVNRFAPGHQLVADAACVWNPETRRWALEPRPEVRARYGDPTLRVNGVAIFAKAACKGGQHVYSARIVQKATTKIRVSLGGRDQNAGSIRVVLSRTTTKIQPYIPSVRAAVAAPAAESPTGGKFRAVLDNIRFQSREEVDHSDEVLEAGVAYRVTVSGTRRIADGVYTDGQCLAINGRWETRGSVDLYRPGATHGALYLGGVRFDGVGPESDPSGCRTHTHTMTYTPSETGRVPLRIWDPTGTWDNDNSLSVRFERAADVAMPAAAGAETPKSSGGWTQRSESFSVQANDADGRVSALKLAAGRSATVYVKGTLRASSAFSADGACVHNGDSWSAGVGLPTGQDLFELNVDGRDVEWKPRNSSSSACDSRHEYSVKFTATKDGPLRLALFDLEPGDNSGYLTVTIVRD